MDNKNIVIRKAERKDIPLLLEFIKGIARYEKMENEVVASGTSAIAICIFIQLKSGGYSQIFLPEQVPNKHPTSTPQVPHKYRTSCIRTIPTSKKLYK